MDKEDFKWTMGCDIKNEQIEIHLRNATSEISRWVVDTREKQIRAALIALGWTPPDKE